MSMYRPARSARATAGWQLQLTPLARPNPFLVGWRYRWELLFAGTLATILVTADQVAGAIGLIAAPTAIGVLAALTFAWPGTRRLAAARVWVVITPHRIRSACAHAWIQTRNGKLPAILRTTAEPFGERVRIWCKPGVSVDDFLSAREQIAAACWAQSVEIGRSARRAHIVIVDVIRRPEPITPSEVPTLRDEPWTGTPWPSQNGHRPSPNDDGEDGDRTRPERLPELGGDWRDVA